MSLDYDNEGRSTTAQQCQTNNSADTSNKNSSTQAHPRLDARKKSKLPLRFVGVAMHWLRKNFLLVFVLLLVTFVALVALEVFAKRAKVENLRPTEWFYQTNAFLLSIWNTLGYVAARLFDIRYFFEHLGQHILHFWRWVCDILCWIIPLHEIWIAMTEILLSLSYIFVSPLEIINGWMQGIAASDHRFTNVVTFVVGILVVYCGSLKIYYSRGRIRHYINNKLA